MSYEDDEKQKEIPPYKIYYNEIPIKLMETIVYISGEEIKNNRLEKDAALKIVNKLRETP